jgi:hypothetical protein
MSLESIFFIMKLESGKLPVKPGGSREETL